MRLALLHRYISIFAFAFAIGGFSQSVPDRPVDPGSQSLLSRAESGDTAAQRELGLAYDRGDKLPQNDVQAAQWYTKAAEQGDAVAENNLGVMCRLGRGVPKDLHSALQWYSKAARQQLPAAFMNIGIAYFNGEGVDADPVQAYAWVALSSGYNYQPAKEALAHIQQEVSQCEVLDAWSAIGDAYEAGQMLPRDLVKAEEWYRKSAEGGSPEAQLKLSISLQSSDAKESTNWLEKSLKQGFAPAMTFIGKRFETGAGEPQDARQAGKWYTKAFRAGDPYAAVALAHLYTNGTSVKPDLARAYVYLYSASKSGLPSEAQEASDLLNRMSDAERKSIGKIHDIQIGIRPEPARKCSGQHRTFVLTL